MTRWHNCPYCGRTCLGATCWRQPCREAARNDPHRNRTADVLVDALYDPPTMRDELRAAVKRP